MFWGLEERQKELQGTGIEEDVESDIQRIEEEYNVIVLPFIKKHPELFRYKIKCGIYISTFNNVLHVIGKRGEFFLIF